jgi:hypothetical protein
MIEELHPLLLQLLPSHSKKLDFRMDAADGFYQVGAVKIS